jgi:hypothetical protein
VRPRSETSPTLSQHFSAIYDHSDAREHAHPWHSV